MGKTKQKKKGKSKHGLIIILAILVIVIGGGMIFYVDGTSAVDPDDKEKVSVSIEYGMGALQILNTLDDAGLVKNKLCSKVFVKLAAPKDIQVNTYAFDKTMSVSEMYQAMEKSDPKYIIRTKFTVIEGTTIPQAAESIASTLGFSADEIKTKWADQAYLQTLIDKYWFLTDEILNQDLMFPLEGYLYPETYFVAGENPTIEEITEMMLAQMDEVLTKKKDEIQNKLGMTIHEFLAFASVVERESLFDADRPKIAGVFKNRLDQNMPLQSDISVLYAHQKTTVAVSYEDLQIDSRYNTYKNPGVPVGAICAVPEKTMDSCINYEKTDAMYFFAKEDGTVIYSNTYEQHQKAVKENKWY